MKNFDYVLPRTVEEAAAWGAKGGAALKGAGIDLLERMKEGVTRPGTLVNLLAIKDLGGIRDDAGTIRIGALATLAEVEANELLRKVAPGLAEAAAEAATPQVRSRATVGGNLAQRPRCWYFRNVTYECSKKGGPICYAREGENKYHAIFGNQKCCIVHPSNLAAPLWTLDAVVHVTGSEGEPKTSDVEIAKFWVTPEQNVERENVLKAGQVITGVSFKAPPPGTGTSYLETREKESFDWALVSAACRLTVDGGVVKDARVVVSAVAPTPMRLEAVEKAVVGKAMSPEVAKAAGESATAGATPLRDNGYKVRHLAVCVARALELAAKRAAGGSK
jgi:xanthine dehydrogenase YagS FAD-binding subunit